MGDRPGVLFVTGPPWEIGSQCVRARLPGRVGRALPRPLEAGPRARRRDEQSKADPDVRPTRARSLRQLAVQAAVGGVRPSGPAIDRILPVGEGEDDRDHLQLAGRLEGGERRVD